jgi:hypothetical protein
MSVAQQWWIQSSCPTLQEAESRLSAVAGAHPAAIDELRRLAPAALAGDLVDCEAAWTTIAPRLRGRLRGPTEVGHVAEAFRSSALRQPVLADESSKFVDLFAHCIAEHFLVSDPSADWALFWPDRIKDPDCRQPAVRIGGVFVPVGVLSHTCALRQINQRPVGLSDIMAHWTALARK